QQDDPSLFNRQAAGELSVR
nr:H-AP=51 kda alkaline phosphatase {N-terminal} [Pseudomonas aeruginosa, PA01, H103, Peptide Partial, 19 aa] [Pseudomonas aeruginosa]